MSTSGRKGRYAREAIQAAAAVFREHGAFIRAVIRFQAGERLDEEDLYQGFFLALIHKPLPPQVRHLRGFLYRAIVSYVLDQARKEARYGRYLKNYARETRISINNRDARNAFIEGEERDALVARLARHLRERYAEAFVLKYRDERSVAEIAARMGVNKRTVSRYLAGSVKRLRGVLTE